MGYIMIKKYPIKSAALAVFEMPNTKPNTDSAEAIADKLSRAKGMYCDHAFYVGAMKKIAQSDLPSLKPYGKQPPSKRCGSSVVEHSIGNGEVESSILSRSTIFPLTIQYLGAWFGF